MKPKKTPFLIILTLLTACAGTTAESPEEAFILANAHWEATVDDIAAADEAGLLTDQALRSSLASFIDQGQSSMTLALEALQAYRRQPTEASQSALILHLSSASQVISLIRQSLEDANVSSS